MQKCLNKGDGNFVLGVRCDLDAGCGLMVSTPVP